VESGGIAPLASNRYGKSLGLASAGAAIGIVWAVLISLVLGIWPLFIAFPPFTIHLVLSALVGAAGTAMLARLWARRLSALVIIAISAVLTFTLFAMLPLYFMFFVPGKAGGLLFS
jgi:hypothetical protein